MPRRRAGVNFGSLGLSQILVIVALILTVLSLLSISVGGIPLIPVAVLLLCIAWLVP
jgi:hypothetical protein